MVQNILKSKTGKLGMIVVIMLIFIIGMLWYHGNGKQEVSQAISVLENREAVTMKIPKSEPDVPVKEAAPPTEEMQPALYENQESIDSEMDMESPETPAEMQEPAEVPVVSITEQEQKSEEFVPDEPETSFPVSVNDQAPAAEDQMNQPVAGSNVPQEEPVVAPPKQAVAKKTVPSPEIRKEENPDGITAVEQQRAAPTFVLHDIRLSENLKGKILEIWANGTIEKFKYFILSNPPRLVIDLPGNWKEPNFRIKAIGNDLISQVRLWRHESKLRIVSDLTSDRALKPVVSPNPDGVEFLLITE